MKYKIFSLLLLFSNLSIAQDWEKTFLHDTGLAKGFDVIQTADNGYVIAGEVDLPTGAIRHYIWLLKTDVNGNLIWSKIYSGGDIANQTGRAITETPNGDLYIAGSNFNKASVLKTNMNGDSLWTRDFGGLGINAFQDIAQDAEGNLVLVGSFEEEFNSGLYEVWVMAMNTAGNSLWSERYFEASFNRTSAVDINALASNNFLVVGNVGGQGFSMKIDGENGNQEWFNTYQLSVGDDLYSGAAHGGEDGFLIGGNITGFAGFSPVLFETNSEGVFTEFVDFYPTPFATISALEFTADGGVVLTGSSTSFWDNWGSNMAGFISKLDADFEVEWSFAYTDSLDKQGASVHQDLDGNYIIAGSRQGGMWLKKIMGNPNATNNSIVNYLDVKVYPNPAHNTVNITIPALTKTGDLFFALYDMLGNLVQKNSIRAHANQVDVGQLARGAYHYTIQNTSHQLSKGVIILQ